MRKGQFEILGLAIVVVLVSVGVFFLLALSLNTDTTDIQGNYFSEQFTSNLLSAYLTSTHPSPGCENYQILDYYRWKIDGAITACAADNQEIHDLLNRSVTDYQGVDFLLRVRNQAQLEKPLPLDPDDSDEREYIADSLGNNACARYNVPATQPINTQSGTGLIILWLCDPQ